MTITPLVFFDPANLLLLPSTFWTSGHTETIHGTIGGPQDYLSPPLGRLREAG